MTDCNDQILNYLLGDLPPCEVKQFEDALSNDKNLQQELSFEMDLLVAINEYGEEQDNISSTLSPKPRKLVKLAATVSSIAAILLLAFFTPTFDNHPTENDQLSYHKTVKKTPIHSFLQTADFGYDQIFKSTQELSPELSLFEKKNGVSS